MPAAETSCLNLEHWLTNFDQGLTGSQLINVSAVWMRSQVRTGYRHRFLQQASKAHSGLHSSGVLPSVCTRAEGVAVRSLFGGWFGGKQFDAA